MWSPTMRKFVFSLVITALAATPALACGPSEGRGIPTVGNTIDAHLPEASLNTADKDQVTLLRSRIQTLVTDGKMEEARTAEEEAMRIMGFKKLWLRCGPGTFAWMKM